jgi:hypothetical protein
MLIMGHREMEPKMVGWTANPLGDSGLQLRGFEDFLRRGFRTTFGISFLRLVSRDECTRAGRQIQACQMESTVSIGIPNRRNRVVSIREEIRENRERG